MVFPVAGAWGSNVSARGKRKQGIIKTTFLVPVEGAEEGYLFRIGQCAAQIWVFYRNNRQEYFASSGMEWLYTSDNAIYGYSLPENSYIPDCPSAPIRWRGVSCNHKGMGFGGFQLIMNKKVLILEDEDNIRSFVVINLKRAGYETVEFALGEDAVTYVRTHNDVDVAILDVMLRTSTVSKSAAVSGAAAAGWASSCSPPCPRKTTRSTAL